MCSITLDSLIKSLLKKALINKNDEKAIKDFASIQYSTVKLSLYMQFFIALGAALTLAFFTAFFYAIEVFQSPVQSLSWGVGFIITAIVFLRFCNFQSEVIKHTLQLQLSLCMMLLGKVLFVIGFVEMFRPVLGWTPVIPVALVTVLTYCIYNVSIDRFISSFALLILLFIEILSRDYNGTFRPLFINLFALLLTLLIGFVFLSKKAKTFYVPLAYAAVCALSIVIVFALRRILFDVDAFHTYHIKFINVLLAFELVLLIVYIGAMGKYKKEPILLASIGSILLGVMFATGAIFSIILMLLGYAKDERFLLWIGILLLPLFLSIHYYSLDLSLVNKAILFGVGGAVLLLGKAYISYRKFDRAV